MGFSENRFSYGGHAYQLDIKLVAGDGSIDKPLDLQKVTCFEYVTELNQLLLSGSVTYDDSHGVVDNFLERQETTLEAHMFRFKEDEGKGGGKEKGAGKVESEEQDFAMHLVCVVQSIEICKRNGQSIRYEIKFVSGNVYRCLANIEYSNWKSGPQDVFQTLKSCFQKVGLKCDPATFDTVQTDVSFKYMTNGNDNAFSVFRYLMNRLYYLQEKDNSLRFVFWNHIEQHYQILDVKDSGTYGKDSAIVVSMARRSSENMMQPEDQQLGTVVECPSSSAIKAMSGTEICKYDVAENSLKMVQTSNDQIASFMSNRSPEQNKMKRKFFPHVNKPYDVQYVRRGAYWNNSFDYYDRLSECMLKNNQLIVETAGDVERVPGCQALIKVERDADTAIGEDRREMEAAMNRFRGIEGAWLASRVRTYVYPNGNPRIRQFISLARNFTVDINPEEPPLDNQSSQPPEF